jgi:glycosyltransferase involved in cell wall biosynthesis
VKLRVALLTEMFSKNMGYLENFLPKYLGRQKIDVHVISTDLPNYYWIPEFKETYGEFSEPLQAGTVEVQEGFTLHILAHKKVAGYMRMVGLWEKLNSVRPDVVQIMSPIGWTALKAAAYRPMLGYKLFTGCHMTASVFPLANRKLPWWNKERLRCTLTRTCPGRFTSFFTEKCYGATSDCADVAVRFFGVSKKKIDVCPLGVDTELFRPVSSERDYAARLELRQKLGFGGSEIVCIYTGRFSEDKNPLLLAKAVAHLVSTGEPFRGLFVGSGVQAQAIQSCVGCTAHPFVRVQDLGNFFRASDIGVWPTQESTSMLDAAACGLPIVVNDTLVATERIDGNGVTYRLNDLGDLIRVLLGLREPQERRRLGLLGAEKMARDFSWKSIARRRLRDYQAVLPAQKWPATRNGEEESSERVRVTSVSDTIGQ